MTTAPATSPAKSPLGFNAGLTISMQCKDMPKSRAWYRDVLGFTPLYELPDIGWCELATECVNVNAGLSQVETPKVGGPVPTFGVHDIEAARAKLEAKKVRFDGETQTIPGLVKLATFFDPDGNALMLFQELHGG
jgi:catechol 2,3-dioxygenase-like lactoylglutathione lyase family enzyme